MALEQFNLNGKTAMVTGSTRGLGEVAAKALAKAGADVVAHTVYAYVSQYVNSLF